MDAVPTTSSRRNGFLGDVRGWFRDEGLVRPRERRWLGGVCKGVADRYGIDPLCSCESPPCSPCSYPARRWLHMPRCG